MSSPEDNYLEEYRPSWGMRLGLVSRVGGVAIATYGGDKLIDHFHAGPVMFGYATGVGAFAAVCVIGGYIERRRAEAATVRISNRQKLLDIIPDEYFYDDHDPMDG